MSAAAWNGLVIAIYFALTLWLGERVARRRHDVEEYFLASRGMPWWSACLSIVGTETSTLTFVGVPAIAYGGDLTFVQLAFGYLVGRLGVAWLLVPAYFSGSVQTAYELLSQRFGGSARRLASVVFLVSRLLADGVRLFATALVLQALLPMPLGVAILGILALTLVYTVRGGLRAVIWNDALQLGVYMGGAMIALVLLLRRIPDGWAGAVAALEPADKLRWLDLGWDATSPYVFWSALIGGAVLTMATHGTDQMFVQRLLACRSEADARRAVIGSGVLVILQFAFFLVLGSLLYVFYQGVEPAAVFTTNDEVFPRFIAEELPAGLGGLVIAAVFAAAMSTLSSSMSSVASTLTLDLRRPSDDERAVVRASHGTTVAAAVGLAAIAIVAQAWGSVLEAGLTITSITFGGVLGVFLLGLTRRLRLRSGHVAVAMLVGIAASLSAQQLTSLAWTWLTPLGAGLTVVVGAALAALAPGSDATDPAGSASDPS